MATKPSFTQLVIQVLEAADHPLTVAEVKARVEMVRPVDTRNPQVTIRNAISNIPLAESLGGRPARYTWWPRHLADNSFRQPLIDSDLASGTLVLSWETWLGLWPNFYDRSSPREGEVTLIPARNPALEARIQHLVTGKAVWGLPATPALAEWYRQQQARPEDELIVRVLDVERHRYGISLARRTDWDEAAISARNQALADAAEAVLRAGRPPLLDSELVTRLFARDIYRDPLPPDPLERVLRADLRFIVGEYNVDLAGKVVDHLEREQEVPPDLDGAPRPQGDRHKARSDTARQAWGEYLFDRGMDHVWVGWSLAAEAYYREALRLDPGHADAWVHLGNLCFEEGLVVEALGHYERGQAAAEARVIGDPSRYPHPFWLDLDSRPFMRALHGRGLCLWRLGRVEEARQVFAWMLELNPNDNQGIRFILSDLDEGLTWEEGAARDEAWEKEQAEAFRLARIWGSQPDDVDH
jgi:tetratricopeptide (TPR) repeat protein